MNALEAARVLAPAGPGEIVQRLRDVLPAAFCSHRDFVPALDYLHGLHPDVASFHYFIEWNLRTSELDLTFTFPTRFARRLRIGFWELAAALGRGTSAQRGSRLVEGMGERLRALPLDAPDFPRAVSFSLGAIRDAAHDVGVELAFADFGPALDLSADPGLWRRAFELIAPEGVLAHGDALPVLESIGAGLALAHVGTGWRSGAPLHKAYLAGRLDTLVRAAASRGAAVLLGAHTRDLERLSSSTGERTAHLVVDVAGGQLARVGFELNFHLDGSEGFAEIAVADALWIGAVPGALRRDAERLIALGTIFRPLADGSHARFRISHLKVSFDGSGGPEWKAYLCFQRSLTS